MYTRNERSQCQKVRWDGEEEHCTMSKDSQSTGKLQKDHQLVNAFAHMANGKSKSTIVIPKHIKPVCFMCDGLCDRVAMELSA